MKYYKEVPTIKEFGVIIASDIIEIKEEEFNMAKNKYEKDGECCCEYITDVPGYIYDLRFCSICGKFLGLI